MTESKGKIITGSISKIRQITSDEIWQITRSNKVVPGTTWVPQLAPSWELFNRFLHEWKGTPPDTWWSKYEEQFNSELRTDERLNMMRKLWSLADSGKVIALVCFCENPLYCHRSLVGQFLQSNQIEVVEINESNSSFSGLEQMSLF